MKYFVYLPFAKGYQEMETAVGDWARNVNDRLRQIAQLQERILGQQRVLSTAGSERWQKQEATEKIERFKAEIQAIEISAEKLPILIRHVDTDTKLAKLGTEDPGGYILFILGHCAPGRKTITETQSFISSQDSLEAHELVTRMIADGLPTGVRNIKLLACYGGKAYRKDSAYATALWQELRKHCTRFRLSAYTEPIKLTTFYQGEMGKTYAAGFQLGGMMPTTTQTGSGLSGIRVRYDFCQYCFENIAGQRCGECQTQLCQLCYADHPCSLFGVD